MKKAFVISIFGLIVILSACSHQSPNNSKNENDKILQTGDSKVQGLRDIGEQDSTKRLNEKEGGIEEQQIKSDNISQSGDIELNFLHLDEYPPGHKVYIQGEDADRRISIQNYQCKNDPCDLRKSDFWIEISNLNNSYSDNDFVPEEEFDEYRGVSIFGDNEFYNGLSYGPYIANTYVLKVNPNIQVRFYAGSDDELISMMLESINIESR